MKLYKVFLKNNTTYLYAKDNHEAMNFALFTPIIKRIVDENNKLVFARGGVFWRS